MESVLKIKKLKEDTRIPTKAHPTDAGFDLYADIQQPISIGAFKNEKIGTGVAIELEEGTFGMIVARSGLATKYGIRPSNCVGIIDSDYRGEVIVPLTNDSAFPYTVNPGDRIAQLIVMPYVKVNLQEEEELEGTIRGAGGFGSTGS
ncbi:MAG: dUTP diphosphatase [Prevotella sp.]|nr:dUTP diphosphatase [Prevotella sp.]